MTLQHFARRICQLLILCMFIILPWLNLHGWHGLQGSLFAFSLWHIPFADPASAAQTYAAAATEGQWPLPGYLWGAIFSLLIALLMGRIFCSWICPYGLLSEILHGLRTKANIPMKARQRSLVWMCKCGWLVLALLVVIFLAYPAITVFSMPGQISLLPIPFWLGESLGIIALASVAPLTALIIEGVARRRLWCQYLCPQSVLLGCASAPLPRSLPGLRIRWSPKKCTCGSGNYCAKACSMNLNPRHINGPSRRDCTMCGDCIEACKKHGGALQYALLENNAKNAKP